VIYRLWNRQKMVIGYLGRMTTQFLTDEKGDKIAVVIPVAEYQELLEDLEDLATAAERRDEETISLEDLKAKLIADGLIPG